AVGDGHVTGPDGGDEPVVALVGQPDPLVDVAVVGHDGQDRAEDLLLGDGGGVHHSVQDGRFDIAAAGLGEGAATAEHHGRPVRHATLDMAEDSGQLVLVDQGAHDGGRVERVAHPEGVVGDPAHGVQEPVLDGGVDHHAGTGVAGLPGVVEDAPCH